MIPGLRRYPGGGNGNPLQYSCLENRMDRGAWWATVHGVIRVRHDSTNSSVQSPSCVRLFVTPWTAAHQASLSITNSWSLLTLMSIELVMPSNHLIFCRPLSACLQSFPAFLSDKSVLHIRWPKYWSFSFSISPSKEYSGLIPFRMDWLDLLTA